MAELKEAPKPKTENGSGQTKEIGAPHHGRGWEADG